MARKKRKIDEAGMFHKYGFPDDGSGITTDDDRPPGNILIGTKMKPTKYSNRLTPFNRNWDYDNGDWQWDHFKNAEGMEDFTNYSQTLKDLEKLLPDKTWKNIWKHMRQVSDKEVTSDFHKSGWPDRSAAAQLGKDKEETADPPKEIQSEDKSLLDRIDFLTM